MKPVEKMFSEKGSWFKGNLHSHTVNSDGRLTPAAVRPPITENTVILSSVFRNTIIIPTFEKY